MSPKLRALLHAWPMIIFMVGFIFLLLLVAYGFVFPATEAVAVAESKEKQLLSAYARLMLAIVLLILFCGVVMILRVKRGLREKLPLIQPVAQKTVASPDPWEESARRLSTKTKDDTDELD